MNLELMRLQIDSPLVHPEARNFRPPSWPPPPDWAPILNADGEPVCRFSDPIWPLDVWAGKALKLNFGNGKVRKGDAQIDSENSNILRLCTTWLMYGPRGCRNAQTLKIHFDLFRRVFIVCSREGIVAYDLMRFEAVIEKVAVAIPPSAFGKTLTLLHDLLDDREQLGFCLLDKYGISRLAKLCPAHSRNQTPYIPPRIWAYQLHRLRECLEDYIKHRQQIEDCFRFCLDAYIHNTGSLKNAMNRRRRGHLSPFNNKRSTRSVSYHGRFKLAADRFGITAVLERWTGPFIMKRNVHQISKFTNYLTVVSRAGLAYLLNFSLMRIEECHNLRSNCLIIEHDEKFGDIPLLVGETTKTDPDADARWPVSKSASIAISAMTHISSLRMLCALEKDDLGITEKDKRSPYLVSHTYEPWGSNKHKEYCTRLSYRSYANVLLSCPYLFEPEQITITEEDLKIAILLTPTLDREIFRVGVVWPFSWHQLRRTGAVNMQTSGLVEDSSLQVLLKHMTRAQSLYYGRNHWHLALNNEARTVYLNTMYEEQARALSSIANPQFVSPLGEDRKAAIVDLISLKDATALIKAIKLGEVSARSIRAGFCFNTRPCPYGGVESITSCLGGEGGKGCPELLLDKTKVGDISRYEKFIDSQLAVVQVDSPRYRALQSEKRSCKKYYAIAEVG
jgi:hypothetical protein